MTVFCLNNGISKSNSKTEKVIEQEKIKYTSTDCISSKFLTNVCFPAEFVNYTS